jgi:hypothetical protein
MHGWISHSSILSAQEGPSIPAVGTVMDLLDSDGLTLGPGPAAGLHRWKVTTMQLQL